MLLTLSQVSSLNTPFGQDLEDFAAAGCTSVEIWLTKLEQYLRSHPLSDARAQLERLGLQAPVASLQGGLLTSQGAARQAAWELFEQRLDLCRDLGIESLVVSCDIAHPLTLSDMERAQKSLVAVAQSAEDRQRRVALEFQAQSALGNNLQTAAALIEEVGSRHLGICLDVIEFWLGPSKLSDLDLLTPENLFHVQLADLADVPRELATDADRILPGDGDLPLTAIVSALRRIHYTGPVSLELLNPRIWQISARQLGEVGLQALRQLLDRSEIVKPLDDTHQERTRDT